MSYDRHTFRKAFPRLGSKNKQVYNDAYRTLKEMGSEIVPHLVERLETMKLPRDPFWKEIVEYIALGKLFRPVREWVDDEDPDLRIRVLAIKLMGEFPEGCVPFRAELKGLTRDRSVQVAGIAREVLKTVK